MRIEFSSTEYMDYALHVSLGNRYVYVVNPKVACSSILWTLRRLELRDDALLPRTVGVIHKRAGSPLLPWTAARQHDLSGFVRFCFVRNPYDRVLSCYLQKIARPTPWRERVRALLGVPARQADISFQQFVESLLLQDPAEMDPHWAPQWRVTLQDDLSYDFIGRFERIEEDLLAAGRRITPDFARYLDREQRQATGKKPLHLLTPDLVETIQRVYDQDFARFNYDRAPPVAH
jgi:hypothetical protein